MEVRGKALRCASWHCREMRRLIARSRDRLVFSKAILKKYLKETIVRGPSQHLPWRAKPKHVALYGLPTAETPEIHARNQRLLAGHTPRRKTVRTRSHSRGVLGWTSMSATGRGAGEHQAQARYGCVNDRFLLP
jgi:hypothetical protein